MKYVFESPPSKIHFAAHARYPHIIAKAKLAHAQQPLPIYLVSIILKVFFGGWGGLIRLILPRLHPHPWLH